METWTIIWICVGIYLAIGFVIAFLMVETITNDKANKKLTGDSDQEWKSSRKKLRKQMEFQGERIVLMIYLICVIGWLPMVIKSVVERKE